VLTGEPVSSEVLAGRLSVGRALADGVILIYGNEGKNTSIRQAIPMVEASKR